MGRLCTLEHRFAVKLHRIRRAVQKLCAQFADLLPQLHGALFRGLSGHIDGTGRIGAGVVGRRVGICAEHRDLIQRAIQNFGRDLRQCGIASGAHIGGTDHQGIRTIIVQFQGGAAHIHSGNAGALHGHAHADGANLAVSHVPDGVFVLPVDHLAYLDKAAIQRTAGVHGTVVGGHHVTFLHGILEPQRKGIHIQLVSQLVHGRFHRKQPLCCTVAAVGTGRHMVGIHHITDKAECFGLAVQRDGFMSGQADCRGAVFAVSTGIGQGVQVDALHDAVFGGA